VIKLETARNNNNEGLSMDGEKSFYRCPICKSDNVFVKHYDKHIYDINAGEETEHNYSDIVEYFCGECKHKIDGVERVEDGEVIEW